MALLTPADEFSNVYKLETTDPVKAGTVSGTLDAPTDGQTNAPLQSLANRTYHNYLRLLPVGTVLEYVGETAPFGFLVCDGASISRSTYAELFAICSTRFGTTSGTTFNIPDRRGNFARGWDNGAGVDPDAASRTASSFGGATGDNIGTEQADEIAAHTHDVDIAPAATAGSGNVMTGRTNTASSPESITSDPTGGNETRPVNIAMNYIIKALV